eukprot:m.284267 g.284267  ORF g.284267 m.284267 type:complete len:402 (-) comp22912_c0_seq7:1819-3024(-)
MNDLSRSWSSTCFAVLGWPRSTSAAAAISLCDVKVKASEEKTHKGSELQLESKSQRQAPGQEARHDQQAQELLLQLLHTEAQIGRITGSFQVDEPAQARFAQLLSILPVHRYLDHGRSQEAVTATEGAAAARDRVRGVYAGVCIAHKKLQTKAIPAHPKLALWWMIATSRLDSMLVLRHRTLSLYFGDDTCSLSETCLQHMLGSEWTGQAQQWLLASPAHLPRAASESDSWTLPAPLAAAIDHTINMTQYFSYFCQQTAEYVEPVLLLEKWCFGQVLASKLDALEAPGTKAAAPTFGMEKSVCSQPIEAPSDTEEPRLPARLKESADKQSLSGTLARTAAEACLLAAHCRSFRMLLSDDIKENWQAVRDVLVRQNMTWGRPVDSVLLVQGRGNMEKVPSPE